MRAIGIAVGSCYPGGSQSGRLWMTKVFLTSGPRGEPGIAGQPVPVPMHVSEFI